MNNVNQCAFSRRFYPKLLTISTFRRSSQGKSQEKEKQQYIAVGTVKRFIETSAKHFQLLNQFPVYNKAS